MGRNSGGNNVSGVPSVKGGAKTLSQASNTLKTAIASGNKSAIDKATKQVIVGIIEKRLKRKK